VLTDYDWDDNKIDHKSTYGYSLSLCSGPICWSSKKKYFIALSSTEVEYRGVVNITIQDMWLQHFLTKLGIQFHLSIIIWCDNQSTLKLYRYLVHKRQTKHIEIHMHCIQNLVHKRIIDSSFLQWKRMQISSPKPSLSRSSILCIVILE
jgi:hypothetical protein